MPYFMMRYPEGKAKAVTFSYDDGVRQDIRLAEILNKYSLKCTFNICKISDGEDGKPSADEIKEKIHAFGHEVAVHGFEHKAPSLCTDNEIIRDVLKSRENLEGAFGRIIRGMAYPDCGITRVDLCRYNEIRNILKSLDIAYART